MRLPKLSAKLSIDRSIAAERNADSGLTLQGTISNNSSRSVWITAGNQKHCLKPGEKSDSVGIQDADGLLLDGTGVLFDSARLDLGGGGTYKQGALKVCTLGSLTVSDAPTQDPALIATISVAGFICTGDSAGYKDVTWCGNHNGWDINSAPLARSC